MSLEPDLFAELDAAEDIMTGRAEAVVTEWGIRSGDAGRVWEYGTDEQRARKEQPLVYGGGTLVRRTVTYSPWREVDNDTAPTAAVREDEGP